MGRILKNWSFKDLCKFLEAYEFHYYKTDGSHYFYYGKINDQDRVVQAIKNKYETKCQSNKTMKLAIRHSGIKKEYFEEWKSSGGKKIHREIIK